MADHSKLPPPSFSLLVTTLAGQAMLSMGALPDPVTAKKEKRLDVARHFIETLAILETKTAGNLTAEETALLTAALHQLRLSFVEAQKEDSDGSKSAGKGESEGPAAPAE